MVARIIGPKPKPNSNIAVRRPLRACSGVGPSVSSCCGNPLAVVILAIVIIGSCLSITRDYTQYSQHQCKRKPLCRISIVGLWPHEVWFPIRTIGARLLAARKTDNSTGQLGDFSSCNRPG